MKRTISNNMLASVPMAILTLALPAAAREAPPADPSEAAADQGSGADEQVPLLEGIALPPSEGEHLHHSLDAHRYRNRFALDW